MYLSAWTEAPKDFGISVPSLSLSLWSSKPCSSGWEDPSQGLFLKGTIDIGQDWSHTILVHDFVRTKLVMVIRSPSNLDGLQELHHRYYEPLCQELGSLGELLNGPPVKKLLFMTDAQAISAQHEPHWKVKFQNCILSPSFEMQKANMTDPCSALALHIGNGIVSKQATFALGGFSFTMSLVRWCKLSHIIHGS